MKLPDRWMNYTKMGKRVSGTRFIPFKVPLREGFSSELTSLTCFTPSQLLASEPRIKLIIDLTYTKKYYDPKVFTNSQVQHKKILCPGGKTGLPPTDVIQTFFNAVDEFLVSHEKDQDTLIGVHCTHGLNRTGYLICKYMISRMNYPPKEAILLFENARGYPIERDVYIKDLMKGSCVSIPQRSKRSRNNSNEKNDWRAYSHRDDSCVSIPLKNKSTRNNSNEDNWRDDSTKSQQTNWRSNSFRKNCTNWRSNMNQTYNLDRSVEQPSTSHFDNNLSVSSVPFVRMSTSHTSRQRQHQDEYFSKNNDRQGLVIHSQTDVHTSRGYYDSSYKYSYDRSRLTSGGNSGSYNSQCRAYTNSSSRQFSPEPSQKRNSRSSHHNRSKNRSSNNVSNSSQYK